MTKAHAIEEIKAAIAHIVAQDEFDHYGLRVSQDPVSTGDAPANSWAWVDGEWTDERLEGCCVISLSRVDVDDALCMCGFTPDPRVGYYFGRHVLLVGYSSATRGVDHGEDIVSDGKVLASWDKMTDGAV